MGAALGLLLGIGLLLVWQSTAPPAPPRPRTRLTVRERTREMLAQAGIEAVTPAALLLSCLGTALVVGLALLVVSRSFPIAGAFALIAGWAPAALVRMRQRKRRTELRDLWPEVTDNLASAVRAGLSLPEALAQVGVRGPEPLRAPFRRFGEDYRATGRFAECLDRLKDALADPVADRIVESLRMAREVGGSDLGTLLRTLSGFLREDARTRAELETRQGWTVNAARLAVAAPWLVLLMLSTSPDAVDEYNSGAGLVVLAGGGAVCVVAYRLMVRLGRLPEEERVLR
ncbi:type II secretion system F family protein [Vallicoccus soli]|uniref:Type II secretion system protein F n=1 Tax=Vallicoccus soli TaxID=2339232 RepID=A0A3A3YZX0_9ACTN|nr:type II secretion system F family protein [Vallicoccus soli]RJK96371.1 type II secretion system protein F [Vallicoccus soli]